MNASADPGFRNATSGLLLEGDVGHPPYVEMTKLFSYDPAEPIGQTPKPSPAMRTKLNQMTEDEREAYVRSLSEQERLWLLILDELTRLHVEVSRLDRRLLKVLATLRDTSIVEEGTEAVYEELEVPFFPVEYRGVARAAQESYYLDRVAAFLYMGEPEKPKRKKRRTRSTRSGATKKNPPKGG